MSNAKKTVTKVPANQPAGQVFKIPFTITDENGNPVFSVARGNSAAGEDASLIYAKTQLVNVVLQQAFTPTISDAISCYTRLTSNGLEISSDGNNWRLVASRDA